MQLDDRSWKLRSVESWLVNRYPGLTVRWVNRGKGDLVVGPYCESYVGQMLQC